MRRTLVEDNQVFSNNAGSSEEDGGGIWLQHGDRRLADPELDDRGATPRATTRPTAPAAGSTTASTTLVEVVHTTFFANDASDADNGDHIQNNGTGLSYANSVIPGGGAVNPCEGGDAATVSGGYNALSPDDICTADGPGDATGVIGIVPGGATANGGPAIGGTDPVPTRTIAISGGIAENRVPVANCAPGRRDRRARPGAAPGRRLRRGRLRALHDHRAARDGVPAARRRRSPGRRRSPDHQPGRRPRPRSARRARSQEGQGQGPLRQEEEEEGARSSG